MFVDYREIKTIDKSAERRLLGNCKKLKHRAIVMLMLDGGLRVTEAISIRWQHVRFKDSAIDIRSLKKKKQTYWTIPMTSKLLGVLSDLYSESSDRSEESFLFPSRVTRSGHMSRKSVWRFIKIYSSGSVYPHMLRHTFASKIVNEGGDIKAAKELLGHASTATTEIYTHATPEAKRKTIELLEPKGFLSKISKALKPRKRLYKIQKYSDYSSLHVGRKNEIKTIENYCNRKINTLILGSQGIGKSHLLSRIEGNKIIRLDDMTSVKTSLGEILLQLYNGDKNQVIQALTKSASIKNVVSRQSIKRVTELLIQSTDEQEYTIVIDDLTHITKQGVITLEHLKNHFHIIAAARKIKVSHESFATNFEKLRLSKLSRTESIHLIGHYASPYYEKIEDFELFTNHVYEHSNGNPLFAIELCKRYRKEPFLDVYTIRNISHTDAVRETDASTFVVIALSSLMVLRYIGGEFGADQSGAFRLFGGVFFVIAIFARTIFQATKRKFI